MQHPMLEGTPLLIGDRVRKDTCKLVYTVTALRPDRVNSMEVVAELDGSGSAGGFYMHNLSRVADWRVEHAHAIHLARDAVAIHGSTASAIAAALVAAADAE